MVYTGQGSYIFWGYYTDSGGSDWDPGNQQNIPFNPMEEVPEDTEPKYSDEEGKVFNNLAVAYKWTKELAPSEVTYECSYRDPFVLLSFFPHKTVTADSPASGDYRFQGDFTAMDDHSPKWIYMHLEDVEAGADHLDRQLKGVYGTSYKWSFEAGTLLKETVGYKVLDFQTYQGDPQTNLANAHFVTNNWAGWDLSGLGSTGKRSPVNISIKWGGSAIGGVLLSSAEMEISTPYATFQPGQSLSHTKAWYESWGFTLTLQGKLSDLDELEEIEKIYSARTAATIQFLIDGTTSYNKSVSCTNCVIDPQESSFPGIPKAGESAEFKLVFKGAEGMAISTDMYFKAANLKGDTNPTPLVNIV